MEPKSKKMIIHVTPSMHADLKAAASKANVSMSEYVRSSIQQRMDLAAVLTAQLKKTGASREY